MLPTIILTWFLLVRFCRFVEDFSPRPLSDWCKSPHLLPPQVTLTDEICGSPSRLVLHLQFFKRWLMLLPWKDPCIWLYQLYQLVSEQQKRCMQCFFAGKSWNPWNSHCRLLLTPNMGIQYGTRKWISTNSSQLNIMKFAGLWHLIFTQAAVVSSPNPLGMVDFTKWIFSYWNHYMYIWNAGFTPVWDKHLQTHDHHVHQPLTP